MLESSLLSIPYEEIVKPDDKSLSHWLTNSERLDASVQPLQRLRDMEEDAYEELVQVWAYMCIKAEGKYAQVHRIGGAGDKGRDVIAYYDGSHNIFDLFQCKHYDHALNYSDLYGEVGKLLTYTFNKTYAVPQNYYLLCPHGVAQSFRDLLSDDANQLKANLLTDWNEKVVAKVGTKNGIKLDEKLKRYIQDFDYSIIREIPPMTFIDTFREEGAPYFFYYFGGGWNAIKKTTLEVPATPAESETNYISSLYDAYSEHAGKTIGSDNITDNKKYYDHLTRSRSAFYSAEEIRLTSRRSTPPESDEFEGLKKQIKTFIGDTYDEDFPDGFTKVKKVVEKAGDYQHSEGLLIGQFLDSNSKQGICHHLSNEGELTWKTK